MFVAVESSSRNANNSPSRPVNFGLPLVTMRREVQLILLHDVDDYCLNESFRLMS